MSEEEEEDEEVMVEAEVMADPEGGGVGRLSHRCSLVEDVPEQVPHGCSPVRVVEVEGEGKNKVSNLEEVVRPQPNHSLHLLMGYFSSGIPSTPGRGILQFDTSRGSHEQLDIHSMEESEEDERPQLAEEARLEANPTPRSTSKPTARRKMKALRKGRSSLGPPRVGENSHSSEVMVHCGLHREVEFGQVQEGVVGGATQLAGDASISHLHDVKDVPLDAKMFKAMHVEGTSADLNVSSHV